ncbi:hypothetical protein [Lignipirellula cremea]|uniref:Uncharacterized protein n=1 Tax=Lignipirellula cremea TaxID=2528010 RepID=A0A518DYB8_9BACT|nr:hypothetical protein [Lignipirellula cremea]QDU96840.1 hypothetical protein Pla8534_46620 [Lignipirellula cremea]
MQVSENQLRSSAAAAFDEKENCSSGSWVTTSLTSGLSLLRDQILRRVHDDVQLVGGMDSMIMSVAPSRKRKAALLEIEIYLIAESTLYVERKQSLTDPRWYAQWLGNLRLPDLFQEPTVQNRLERYLVKTPDERRMKFARVLEKTLPEATRAPLVLYRLIPSATEIVTAVALGDVFDPSELRNQQLFWLPSISDCQDCLGRPLDNGEQCKQCGNPIWHYAWLESSD